MDFLLYKGGYVALHLTNCTSFFQCSENKSFVTAYQPGFFFSPALHDKELVPDGSKTLELAAHPLTLV